MNKLVVRQYDCEENNGTCKRCFELERLSSDQIRKSEPSHIIVTCKDHETRDNWIRIITKVVADLRQRADMLENPQSYQ